MITGKAKQDLLEYMAGYDTDAVLERMDTIRQLYRENLHKYENTPEQKSHKKARNAITKHAKALSQALKDTPPHLQVSIDETYKHPGYVMHLTMLLDTLQAVVKDATLNRNIHDIDGITRPMKKKPEFHRDCLIRSLRSAYKDFTGKEANTGYEFNKFMRIACDYMGIIYTGLENKHEELTTQNKLGSTVR